MADRTLRFLLAYVISSTCLHALYIAIKITATRGNREFSKALSVLSGVYCACWVCLGSVDLSYLEFTVLDEFVSEAWICPIWSLLWLLSLSLKCGSVRSGVYCTCFCIWNCLLYCHNWHWIHLCSCSLDILEASESMVYKPCPQCGKSNHHNKVKCAECGVCLRAGKPGRPKKTTSDKKFCPLAGSGRPCIQVNVLCPSCGHFFFFFFFIKGLCICNGIMNSIRK